MGGGEEEAKLVFVRLILGGLESAHLTIVKDNSVVEVPLNNAINCKAKFVCEICNDTLLQLTLFVWWLLFSSSLAAAEKHEEHQNRKQEWISMDDDKSWIVPNAYDDLFLGENFNGANTHNDN